MITEKKVAIIDGPNQAITRVLRKIAGPYRLLLIQREQTGCASHIEPSETIASDCPREACWEADIIIVPATHPALGDLAERIREVAVGKVVISMGYGDADTDLQAISTLESLLPYSHVVAVSIASSAASLNVETSGALVSARNSEALHDATRMLESAGFSPVATAMSA
jgi:predicted dinucleotide-binding enzyme